MTVTDTPIAGLLLLTPRVFSDPRGEFMETFNQRRFSEATSIDLPWVQDNQAQSQRGVLRGLHYQRPNAQGKLLRVVSGEIFDVAVDLRADSPTFGRWFGAELSAANRRQLWIPPEFAHGYLVLSDRAEVLYKTTAYYSPADERCIAWDDPDLAIDWPLSTPPILSAKDTRGLAFRDTPTF